MAGLFAQINRLFGKKSFNDFERYSISANSLPRTSGAMSLIALRFYVRSSIGQLLTKITLTSKNPPA
jgi:hypothetical protein